MIRDYIAKARDLTETYNREMDALKDEMSKEIGLTVLGIDDKIHVGREEYMAALAKAIIVRPGDALPQDGAPHFVVYMD